MQLDFQIVCLIVTCALLAIVVIAGSGMIYRVRISQMFAIEIFLLSFALRVGLLMFNEQYGILEHKVADERSVEFYLDYTSGKMPLMAVLKDQFALQIVVSLPFFVMFGARLITVQLLNCMYGAIIAPLVGVILAQAFSMRIGKRAMLLFCLYPASVNFSIFGLRDPLIFMAVSLFFAAAMAIHRGMSRTINVSVALVSCVVLLLLRPELSYVVFTFMLGLALPFIMSRVSKEQLPIEKAGLVGGVLGIILLVAGGLAVTSLKIASMQIGANTINPWVIADELAEERFSRVQAQGSGGGTHLFDEETYANLPVYYRIPVQTVGLVVLPYPWLIHGVSQVLAFLDSLYLIAALSFGIIVVMQKRRATYYVLILVATFSIGVLGMGLIVNNAGNGFRMRYALVPAVLIAASFSRYIPTFSLRDER